MAKRIKKKNFRAAQQAAYRADQQAVQPVEPLETPRIPENEDQTPVRAAFSGWPMILGWLAMLIFAIHACTHMVAAGDTWVAMACGRHFANHGVDTVEPFSANSHKAGPTVEEVEKWPGWAQWITKKVGLETVKKWHPTGWVNQNWLTHLIFYSLIPESSYADGVSFSSNALVYWKFAIYIITIVCVYYMGRLLGANPALCAVFACFALFVGRSFLDVRPAGFSNMLTAVFLLVLILTAYRNVLFIWLLVPVTIFWCNVHGGYIYVFIMLVPFLGWHVLMLLPKKWIVAIYCILAWIVFYAFTYNFRGHANIERTELTADWLFYFLLIFIAANIILTANKQTKSEVLHAFNIGVSILVFLCLIARFFPPIPRNIPGLAQRNLTKHISSSRWAFLAFFFLMLQLKLILAAFTDRVFRRIKVTGALHIAGAGLAAFIASIVFNPFHLTNLTHTFAISVSEHAARWRDIHEWHPAFEWSNPVGTAVPFLWMYIISWVALAAWAIVLIVTYTAVGKYARRKAQDLQGDQWPKIDLSLLLIAALTIYMAIRSRRFIPIAAIAACPIIAVLIDQAVRYAAATSNFRLRNRLAVPRMPKDFQWVFIVSGALAVIIFGTWWGRRFKHVYLDAWPNDPKLSSVFMRMTASDAKPFYALKFIKDNKLSGKMFNYWTEGGFIAWGQEPDPNTGHTPLQLFMDGRAQAAYDRDTFDLWTRIMSGGPTVHTAARNANVLGKSLAKVITSDDHRKIGVWVSAELREHNAWLVMMPAAVYSDPSKPSYHFLRGLQYNRDWPIVFMNNKQRILVDITTSQGKDLFNGLFTNKTKFPNKFHKNLILGHNYLLQAGKNTRKRGLDLVQAAFKDHPSPAPMLEVILVASRYKELNRQIVEICTGWVEEFSGNQEDFRRKDGYRLRLEAARLACTHLERVYKQDPKNAKLAGEYRAKMVEYITERGRLSQSKRW